MEMKTLVIFVPSSKAQEEGKRSFAETLKKRTAEGYSIGDGYAIASTEIRYVINGCDVIVVDEETQRRAEGKLVKLVRDVQTKTGMWRYNVYMERLEELEEKDYKPIPYTKAQKAQRYRGILIV
jgi:hypothetical protein